MSLYRRAIALLEGGGAKSGTLEQQAASKKQRKARMSRTYPATLRLL